MPTHAPRPVTTNARRNTSNGTRRGYVHGVVGVPFTGVSGRTAPMRVRVFGLALLWAMWLLPAVALAWRLVGDAEDYLGTRCEIPRADSDYGTASWSWWPPGETCRDHAGQAFRKPSHERSMLLVTTAAGVLVLPLLTLALVRSDRANGDLGDGTLIELLGADSAGE